MYKVYTKNMKNTLSATEARNNFFEMLNAVMYKGEKFIVEKDGRPAATISPLPVEKSAAEIEEIMADVRKVFAKSVKRKYWSVIDTPAWKKKESKYLENLSKGIVD